MGGHFLLTVLVTSIFGDRNRFESGKGDNGGVEPLSMSGILTKGGWENEIHNKASTYITHNPLSIIESDHFIQPGVITYHTVLLRLMILYNTSRYVEETTIFQYLQVNVCMHICLYKGNRISWCL